MTKKYIIGIISLLLALIIPLASFVCLAVSLPDVYGETFLGALEGKYKRLCSIDSPKLVVVGGSSVAFGLDSEVLERELNMPVVNFGLYATLGTKLMMDLSRANVNEGDIVILSPEMNSQTLSLYFNAESTWQAIESSPSILKHIAFEDLGSMAGAYYSHNATKLKYVRDGVKLSPDGIYRSDSFNEYGDIDYDRPYNTMYASTGMTYDTANKISLSTDIVSPEFTDYVNDYVKWCEKKGARVYFSFCPMNIDGFETSTDKNSMIEMFEFLTRKLDCPVINSPIDTAYESNYFYDTNFHLNDAGVSLHTRCLLTSLYRQLGRTDIPTVDLLEMPDLPIYEGDLSTDGNDFEEMFVYEEYGSGYALVGTTEAARDLKYLEIPSSHNGRAVIALNDGLFKDCPALTEIRVYKSISVFSEKVFESMNGSLKVYMSVDDAPYMTDEDAPLPQVSMELLDNTDANVTFCFSQKGFERFLEDYSWQQHGEHFEVVE